MYRFEISVLVTGDERAEEAEAKPLAVALHEHADHRPPGEAAPRGRPAGILRTLEWVTVPPDAGFSNNGLLY